MPRRDGVVFGGAYCWPGPIHEGNGFFQLAVDDKGEERRAQIHLPNGFEYKQAEVGNTVHLRAALGDKRFEHRNTYAQFNAVDWNNS